MDLISMETTLPDKTVSKSYGTLGTMLGLIADIDIESESMRCFGQSFRTTLYAIMKIAKMREYDITLSYLPATEKGSALVEQRSSANDPKADATVIKNDSVDVKDVPVLEHPDQDWITITDKYISVQGLALSHMSSDHVMFPDLGLSSGYMNIALLKTRSRSKIFKLWDDLEDGTGFLGTSGKGHLKVISCYAFRITPARKQIVTLDGEYIASSGEVYCKIHKSMARVLSRRPAGDT